MKKGDLVCLSVIGRLQYVDHPANPHDEIGEITRVGGAVNLRWIWGSNCYDPSDLKVLDKGEFIGKISPGRFKIDLLCLG